MTREDIILMAREAGFITSYGARETATDKLLERFAELVAAAENKACEKACEEVGRWPSLGPRHCAAAIRARGQA
jgi:hypothetical protein